MSTTITRTKTVKTVKTVRTVKRSSVPTVAGAILYQGPSMLDGKPIVVIATFKTKNRKTGDVVQTWILRADIDPMVAVETGQDASICGTCPLRGIAMAYRKAQLAKARADRNRRGRLAHGKAKGRSCYVNIGQAPRQVYEAFKRGIYPVATDATMAKHIKGRTLRLGSYGDPVAAPVEVWEQFLAWGKAHGNGKRLGYTHQYALPIALPFRGFLMASTQSESTTLAAQAMGWRTFRVRRFSDPLMANEVICPASDEGNHARSCNTCHACKGCQRPGQANVVIIGHASKPVLANVKRMLDSASTN